jgi:hypothetical protein
MLTNGMTKITLKLVVSNKYVILMFPKQAYFMFQCTRFRQSGGIGFGKLQVFEFVVIRPAGTCSVTPCWTDLSSSITSAWVRVEH